MSKKAFKPPRIAPLQRVVAEEVTDPDEIAAMEEVYKEWKRMQKKQKELVVYRRAKKSPKTKTKPRRPSEPEA